MVVASRRNSQGTMVVEWQKYFADGKPVMIERDRDGDGRLEVITVFRPDDDSSERFTRDPDGTVKPARELNEHEVELLLLARKQLANGELDAAEGNLQMVIDSAPHHGAAYYYLTLVQHAKQRAEARRRSRSRYRFWYPQTVPNHALQRTRPSRRGCKRTPSWAGSLSLGRSASRE